MGYYTLPDKKDRNEETAFYVLQEPLKNQAKEILAKVAEYIKTVVKLVFKEFLSVQKKIVMFNPNIRFLTF